MNTDNARHGEWAAASTNPDPVTDLGYEHPPLTTIYDEAEGGTYILVPGADNYRSDAEFLSAHPGSVEWLSEWR